MRPSAAVVMEDASDSRAEPVLDERVRLGLVFVAGGDPSGRPVTFVRSPPERSRARNQFALLSARINSQIGIRR